MSAILPAIQPCLLNLPRLFKHGVLRLRPGPYSNSLKQSAKSALGIPDQGYFHLPVQTYVLGFYVNLYKALFVRLSPYRLTPPEIDIAHATAHEEHQVSRSLSFECGSGPRNQAQGMILGDSPPCTQAGGHRR
jgi:hypothetical protein